ncbi:hypothetical protein Fmac_026323 [Flemingia macrophylla]|uniref:Uncharacterized protein n=1 Tax=Flemingia macrophylla TaxID=520843 RepID=A0ABD1LEI7_9FABA
MEEAVLVWIPEYWPNLGATDFHKQGTLVNSLMGSGNKPAVICHKQFLDTCHK